MATILNSTLRIGPPICRLVKTTGKRALSSPALSWKMEKPIIQTVSLRKNLPALRNKIMCFYDAHTSLKQLTNDELEQHVTDLKQSFFQDDTLRKDLEKLKHDFNQGYAFEFTDFPILKEEQEKSLTVRHGLHGKAIFPFTQVCMATLMYLLSDQIPDVQTTLHVKAARDVEEGANFKSPFGRDLDWHNDGGSGGELNRITAFSYFNDAKQKTCFMAVNNIVEALFALKRNKRVLKILQQPYFSCGINQHSWPLLFKESQYSLWGGAYSKNFTDFQFNPPKNDPKCPYTKEQGEEAILLLNEAITKASSEEQNVHRLPSVSVEIENIETTPKGKKCINSTIVITNDSTVSHARPIEEGLTLDEIRSLARMHGFKQVEGNVVNPRLEEKSGIMTLM